IHRIAGNGEILSRIVPEECCWYAGQSRRGGSRISDNLPNCTAFMDRSHRSRDKEWSGSAVHPGVQAILRQRGSYENFPNGRNDGNYIVIGAGSSSDNERTGDDEFVEGTEKQMNVKIEEEGSPKRSNIALIKRDGNVC
ncbi:PREDICTED: LOW QUALITY PROTEIN: uncharacterized protein LOC107193914, partial [Dufourea novaeangliae]|uniref:LOW QUALITY PROTEIN: uncharacterized protein LOC107193914 n=1 Tax=Dufourea novaeangliae TaxID=178035 RepID=UPI0007678FB6